MRIFNLNLLKFRSIIFRKNRMLQVLFTFSSKNTFKQINLNK